MALSGSGAANPQANILLVDDRPDNRHVLEQTLGDLGPAVIRVPSGPDALRRLREQDYAAVFLNLEMQELDGFETARSIREQETSRHTPIVFLAPGESKDFALVDAYALGGVDYLVKPVAPEILKGKVAGFVELFRRSSKWSDKRSNCASWSGVISSTSLPRQSNVGNSNACVRKRPARTSSWPCYRTSFGIPWLPWCHAGNVLRLLGPADPDLQWTSGVISRQVQHLARLVDDLLDVTRITKGKIHLQKERSDLASIVARALETSRPFIAARNHELTVSVTAEPVRLDADPVRLAQVLSNLLNNAAKYTEDGGHIWLNAEKVGDEVVVEIRDNGVGIPADMLPRVFDLYTQVDRSLDRSQGGLGIGLTLVRRLVELHGGSVKASSAGPGQGSKFVVRMPAMSKIGGSTEQNEPHPAPAQTPPRRILVVDDDRDAIRCLAMLLQATGHEVHTAHDGSAALKSAEYWPPEVVLLDIGLPRMDGYEVARRLRKLPGQKDALLVAMTGYGQEEDRVRSREAGFDFHLVKPVDLAELQRVLSARPETAHA